MRSSIKLFALITLLAVLAFFGIKWQSGQVAAFKIVAKRNQDRLGAMKQKEAIRHDVAKDDDQALVDGITRK